MARSPKPAGAEQDNDEWVPTDSELGVGEETPAEAAAEATAKIAAVMADPTIAMAIEQLVQQRVAELAITNGAAPGVDLMAGFKLLAAEMAAAISKNTNAMAEQIPGHVKPIPVEEVERRAAAWIELQSMLADVARQYWTAVERNEHAEAERITPHYILDEDFFGPGEVGSEMYVRGETIRWFGAPGVYMQPRNAIATKLSETMWEYLGNENAPSAEDLAQHASKMNRPSAPGSILPEMPLLLSARGRGRPNASRVSEAGIAERGPDNIVGTVVKVTRGGFGHGIVTDGPGLAPHSIGPRSGPHPVRGSTPDPQAL
jgi:hypothetical protein